MSTYIFILGKDPELSLAELHAMYPKAKYKVESDDFVVLESTERIDQKEFDQLGGQVKAGHFVSKIDKKNLVSKLAEQLTSSHSHGKLNYGISVYGWSEKNLRSLLLDLKKEFKRREISSRFANQKFLNISAAQHKGLKDGKELLVCKHGADFYIAEIVAVQDIDAYSKRDYKKPYRDMKVGMLPPKLAQIMINLAGDVGPIWDPFCGGGVLIMEGLLMGHSMLGSDINKKTLDGAQNNIDWLKKEFKMGSETELFHHDATKPISDKKFDAIVCEGYLGPPQDRMKSKKEFDAVVEELTKLYVDFFKALAGFKGPVVIAVPFYRTREGELRLEKAIKEIEKLGFKKKLNLKYAREDQLVGRDIFQFSAG